MTISTLGNSGPQSASPQPVAVLQSASANVPKAKADALPVVRQNDPTPEQLQMAMETMKRMIDSKAPNSLAFSVDDRSGKTIVRITDTETGETIRQIPSEELLAIARSLDKMQGMLLKQQA